MTVAAVMVVGGGLMGSGIAQVCAQAGIATTVREVTPELADKARGNIVKSLGKGVEKGVVTPAARDAALAHLSFTTDLGAAAASALVIEAIVEDLSAKDNLAYWGAAYGMRGDALKRRVLDVLERVGLADRAREPVKRYSGGMKRRLNFACGIVHQPKVLLLDEPTVGVDPQSRNAIFDNLEQLKRRGKALLYTTHYMEEAERLADRIVIVDHGRVIADDTLAGLHRAHPGAGTLETVFLALTGRRLRD